MPIDYDYFRASRRQKLDSLENRCRRLTAEAESLLAARGLSRRNLFLARTTTSGTYPSEPANTYEICFDVAQHLLQVQ